MASIDVDFGAAADFAARDLRGTITYYLRSAANQGIFKTASGGSDVTVGPSGSNTDVVVGCLVTIGGSSYTITAVATSDNKTVTLSGDPASGDCTAIGALKISGVNLTLNSSGPTDSLTRSPNTDQQGIENYAWRTPFKQADQAASGNYIRATLVAHSTLSTQYSHVCFAEIASGINAAGAFGSAKFKEFLFSGAQGVTIPGGQTRQTDWLQFDYDKTKNYMLIYSLAASNGNHRYGAYTGDSLNYKAAAAADYNVQNVSGYTPAANNTNGCIKLEVMSVPTVLYVGHTTPGHTQLNSSQWADINSWAITASIPGSSKAWFARSFNVGSATEVWKVWTGSAYRDIARLNAGAWEYRNNADTWAAASVNDRDVAIGQAMAAGANNQMTKAVFDAISDANLLVEAATLDFAVGLQADGINIPTVDRVAVNYDPVLAFVLAGGCGDCGANPFAAGG